MSEPGRRRVVDGALFGLYEDDEPERRPPWLLLGLLLMAAAVVVALVWRAVNTEATLAVPDGDRAATTTTTDAGTQPPTADELRLLIPPGLGDCVPPQLEPEDGPPRAALWCTGPGGPGTVELTLYGSVDERDDAFDYVAAVLEAPAGGGDCALGRPGRHDYLGVEQVGQLACQSADGGSHLLWTSDRGPILASANSADRYAELYAWWAALVDRTDAGFPTGVEQALLDRLPDSLLDGCDRDPDLRIATGGDLAVTCRPERSPAREVSWISFADQDAMTRWLRSRRERLGDVVVADADDACSPEGFGRPAVGIDDDPAEAAEPPAPQAGDTTYELAGSTGSVLCHQNPAGRGVVTWARDDGLLGSVAVAADGVAITDLLAWWQRGGHLP